MLAQPQLAFLEIDTTGLERTDEIVRFTLIDAKGQVLEDCLIKPATRELGSQVSAINGITPEQLRDALPMTRAWERIQRALRGRTMLSFGLGWDLEQLHRAARLHRLTPIQDQGECLQLHAARYYHREYGLKLAELCARVGTPLPAYPKQTSLDRARGQLAVLQGFAQAITDVRPPVVCAPETPFPLNTASAGDGFDPFLDLP